MPTEEEADTDMPVKTITLDEIMGDGAEDVGETKEDEDDDEDRNYYQVFVNEIRRKE